MKSTFSEFSYGYAVTEELMKICKAKSPGAPIFPSLYEEGKSGGYDVKIPTKGKPIFLQFKLTDCLTTRNALEYKNGLLSLNYYRMYLRPLKYSNQHNLLLNLERRGRAVYYIAPEFHLVSELHKHYNKQEIIDHSAFFAPSDIGPLPDIHEHYIVFKRNPSTLAYRCSKLRKSLFIQSLN